MTDQKPFFALHKGDRFDSQGLGKFAKDVVRIGKWIHPATGREVFFDVERLRRLAENTQRYLAAGNKIPFPDGHSFEAVKNLGDWPGPFIVHKDRLVGVVEPKAQGVAQKLNEGSIDSVSAYIEFDVKDSKGNAYPEVITHVCATPYPVVTEQEPFLKLSRESGLEVLLPEELSARRPAAQAPAPDPAAEAALEKLVEALERAKSDPFEACVHELKRKGHSKEDAIKACKTRFEKDPQRMAADPAAVARAFLELASTKTP